MRRAAFILCLLCVSALVIPVALRAAADTDRRAGVAVQKVADVLPPAILKKQTPPRSATQPIAPLDPHPVLTEFFGPAKKNISSPKSQGPTRAPVVTETAESISK